MKGVIILFSRVVGFGFKDREKWGIVNLHCRVCFEMKKRSEVERFLYLLVREMLATTGAGMIQKKMLFITIFFY